MIETVILTDVSCSISDDFKTDKRNIDLEYVNIRTRKIRHKRTVHSRRQIIDRILQQIECVVHTYSGYVDRPVEEQRLDDHRANRDDYLLILSEMIRKSLQQTGILDIFRQYGIRYSAHQALNSVIQLKTTGQQIKFLPKRILGRIELKEWNQSMMFSPYFG